MRGLLQAAFAQQGRYPGGGQQGRAHDQGGEPRGDHPGDRDDHARDKAATAVERE